MGEPLYDVPATYTPRGDSIAACVHFEKLDVHPEYDVYDIDLYEDPQPKRVLNQYFKCCFGHSAKSLAISTSCFGVWRKAKKTNGAGKVIPAIRELSSSVSADTQRPRVFFFDDNINLHLGGSSDSEGICNLCDLESGQFVDFNEGANGFKSDRLFSYTVVRSSSEYRNVLVQANILDAMVHPDYFTSIISKYSNPDDMLLVFADVNGTIVWDDKVQGKTSAEILLSTMFTFIEIWPRDLDDPVDFSWKAQPSICIDKREDLRSLVKRISNKDDDFYLKFWSLETCEHFLDTVTTFANIGYCQDNDCIEATHFFKEYHKNLQLILDSVSEDGIPQSWFKCYEQLSSAGHSVVLNSFGVDSMRVARRLVPDVRQLVNLTFNYKLWSERDMKMWTAQFQEAAVQDA